MVESSDLQSAIQRTQAMERVQQLQNQQEELNRKRFELELAKQREKKSKKVADAEKAEHKRVVRDQYDGNSRKRKRPGSDDSREDSDDESGRGGNFDVRV